MIGIIGAMGIEVRALADLLENKKQKPSQALSICQAKSMEKM